MPRASSTYQRKQTAIFLVMRRLHRARMSSTVVGGGASSSSSPSSAFSGAYFRFSCFSRVISVSNFSLSARRSSARNREMSRSRFTSPSNYSPWSGVSLPLSILFMRYSSV
jgi:hypothetical protein